MILIKREKLERASNFARVMREVTMLGSFIRLADYLFVESEWGVQIVRFLGFGWVRHR